MFCCRAGDKTERQKLVNRGRRWNLLTLYLVFWQVRLLLGVEIKKQMGREVIRGRSMGSTEDGSREARKAATGVLLQTWE